VSGCGQSNMEYATKWTADIKKKILEDVNVVADSMLISGEDFKKLTLYSEGIRTKYFHIQPGGDTVLSIFYSRDQNFELVRELCPAISRSFEGVNYKGNALGLWELRYCNGKLKQQGYRFNRNVGIEKEWDENGKLIREADNGNIEKLAGIRKIKYYR
jgi:hypothetical protein